MAVFRWGESWFNYHDLEREVERLLHEVAFSVRGMQLQQQFPLLNLYETDEEYLLTADLPGTSPDDIELTVEHGMLTLKGHRDDPLGIPDDHFRRRERYHGSWQRSVTLPDRVDIERLSAETRNGVLVIHLPRNLESASRRIPVTEGGE